MDCYPNKCPFCGNSVQMLMTENEINPDEKYWIECENCEMGQMGLYEYADAIERWNRRS